MFVNNFPERGIQHFSNAKIRAGKNTFSSHNFMGKKIPQIINFKFKKRANISKRKFKMHFCVKNSKNSFGAPESETEQVKPKTINKISFMLSEGAKAEFITKKVSRYNQKVVSIWVSALESPLKHFTYSMALQLHDKNFGIIFSGELSFVLECLE